MKNKRPCFVLFFFYFFIEPVNENISDISCYVALRRVYFPSGIQRRPWCSGITLKFLCIEEISLNSSKPSTVQAFCRINNTEL